MITKLKSMLGLTPGDECIGSICVFAGNFAPRNYTNCDGKLLSIKNYTALFAIVGTTYGGDGINTFAVPDLRPTKNGVKVDWSELYLPREVICVNGYFPDRG